MIHGIAGAPFTIGSPKQLGDILFDKMGLKGSPTGELVLEEVTVTAQKREQSLSDVSMAVSAISADSTA